MKSLFVGLITSMLSSCSVTPKDWAAAEHLCKANGGISYYTPNFVAIGGGVKCVNGSYIEFSNKVPE